MWVLTLLLVVNVLCRSICFIWVSCPDSLNPDDHFLLMERLREIGLDPNSTRSECLDLLSTQSTNVLLNLRSALFSECHKSDLLHQGDELVSRRVTRTGKSLSVKLSEDISSLIISLKNQTAVPRTLLKNGKRDKSYLDSSRSRNISSTQLLSECLVSTPHHTAPGSSSAAIPAAPLAVPPVTTAPLQQATLRGIVKDVNSLKDEVKSLKMDILALNKSKQPSPSLDSCHVCVICSDPQFPKRLFLPSLCVLFSLFLK